MRRPTTPDPDALAAVTRAAAQWRARQDDLEAARTTLATTIRDAIDAGSITRSAVHEHTGVARTTIDAWIKESQ